MAAPPVDAGAVQDTDEEELAYDVAPTPVGAPGAVAAVVGAAGVAGAEAPDAAPVPTALVAVTVNV